MRAAPLRDCATYGYGQIACVWKQTGDVIGFSGPKYLPELGETELGLAVEKQVRYSGLAGIDVDLFARNI